MTKREGNGLRRELVLRVFHNEPAERVPVGFWFHFLKDELEDAFDKNGVVDPQILNTNLAGHEKFYRAFQPDFLKIMTDGFFIYPNETFTRAKRAADLREVKPIGADHPWIRRQIEFAKTMTAKYGAEVLCFYNIFAPATYFKFCRHDFPGSPDRALADFIEEDREAVIHALGVVAEDIAALARGVIAEGGADGIYFSVQDLADQWANAALHRDCIAPSDIAVLEGANAAAQLNILHICGYEGHRNDLSHYTSYPAQIINWAVAVDGVSLGVGKKLFGGKPVIGGFDNMVKGVLYRGGRDAIEAETDRLLKEAGTVGVALGADCTVPRDIDLGHLAWVRDRAAACH
ncbi:uroporphyrinogen decarboxylase [Spirochaetia bacterium]|nr:uroporphyrinogen decarboxylase [Spirochaetia bacterium]